MSTLIIETATAACSVALVEGECIVARAHAIVGRGHAERLVPMIAQLPAGGRADRILVDCGPGSFTGVRVGLAAARGLAIGWGVPISGYSSLALIAAAAFRDRPCDRIAVVLEGGHGEVFVQRFSHDLSPLSPLVSLAPAAAIEAAGRLPMVGNGVRFLLALDPGLDAREALPDAGDAMLLTDAATALPATPVYGRAPDAKPMVVT